MKCVQLFLSACLCGILWGASEPAEKEITDPKTIASASNPDARVIPIDDLYFVRHVSDASWSPDGWQVLFSTNLTGRLNLWKVAASGGWPVQLTQSDDVQWNETWSPDGKWIVFQQDHGGNEVPDLYAIPSDGGELVNLTRTEDIGEGSPLWSPDGKILAIGYEPRDSPNIDIALLDWATKEVRRLTHEQTPNHQWWCCAGWSPDGATIYASRVEAGVMDSDVYSLSVATGKAENLTPHTGHVRYLVTAVSPDGKTLLLASDAKAPNLNVAMLDVPTRRMTWVTETKWDAYPEDFSSDGKTFIYAVNEDGRTDMYLAERDTGHSQKILLPEGLNIWGGKRSFAPQGDRVLVSHQSSKCPSDLWVYDVKQRSIRQLTFSAIASLNASMLPQSQLVHYKSFDGRIISAFLWLPFNLRRDGSNPAIVLAHGGPAGQWTDTWDPEVAALVSRGYICIAPNFRGSTGYGVEFQQANYQDLGGGDLQDIVYAVEFLKATGYVNPRKIGITGGSYGGFLTLMAIGKTPGLWAAAVEMYGIVSWYTILKHAAPGIQEYDKSLLGDPEKDRKVYEAASPIQYLHNARAPLLVLHGDNDPIVPKEEAEQVVATLKKGGEIVQAHYYENEGHIFHKRENQIDSIRRTVEWFDRYLKNKE